MREIQLFGDSEESLLEQALSATSAIRFPKGSAAIDAFLSTPLSDWKKSERPDFVSKNDLGVELMRVDDHPEVGRGYNRYRARERNIQNEVRESFTGDEVAPGGKILVNGVSDLPTLEDHNYQAWLRSFRTVVGKHAMKVDAYRDRPDVELLAFLIVDESSGYVEGARPPQRDFAAGTQIPVRQIHYWWRDSRFLEVLRACQADVVLWSRPFAYHPSLPVPRMHLVAIDLSLESIDPIKYDTTLMTPVER